MITNIKVSLKHDAAPGECTNAWKVDSLPKNYVLIDLSRFGVKPIFNLPQHTRLPIRDSDLRQTTCPRMRATSFWVGDRQFTLRVWTGRDSSSADRSTLAALVKSISPS